MRLKSVLHQRLDAFVSSETEIIVHVCRVFNKHLQIVDSFCLKVRYLCAESHLLHKSQYLFQSVSETFVSVCPEYILFRETQPKKTMDIGVSARVKPNSFRTSHTLSENRSLFLCICNMMKFANCRMFANFLSHGLPCA